MPNSHFPSAGLVTERLLLRPPGQGDAYALLAYYTNNREHLRPWEPERKDDFYTHASIAARLEQMALQMSQGQALNLVLVRRDIGVLIGNCNLSNIVRGVLQACHLGFGIDQHHEGQGLMREALEATIEYAFKTMGLHRIMANHLPENQRSGQLLTRMGFQREGLARSYLHINGAWRDHVLTALINEAA